MKVDEGVLPSQGAFGTTLLIGNGKFGNTLSMIARTIITTLTIAATLGAHALFLHTDGLIKVKGGSWRDVTITVVPEFSAPFEIALTGPHFKLDLPVYSTYLLRAEHPGCAAKAILFDCTVPERLGDLDFEFPFEVELEMMTSQEAFEYAGPVGLVSFNELKTDFTYNTDYTKIHDVPALPQLERVMASALGSHGIDQLNLISGLSTMPKVESISPAPPTDVPLPAPVSHIKQVNAMREGSNSPSVLFLPAAEEQGSDRETELAFSVVKASEPKESHTVSNSRESNTPHIVPIAFKPNVDPGQDQDKSEQCNTHQFIQERRYVMTIDRVATDDGCLELKRVSHAYGAVYYFINGMAATGERYSTTLRQVAPSIESDKVYVQN